jgi:diadenosine tetraphosphate (Ap4A) HIT family hydrolase
VPENTASLPDFTRWPSFPFEGDMHIKKLAAPVDVEPPRSGEDASECVACNTPDEAYIWVSERWRVRAMDRPTGLPMVLILECRSHLDLGDLPNLLAAELGVMTVRLERAIRSLDGVARVHVNRWGDGSAHLHMWFLARPYGRLQLRGTFLSLWDDILPVIPEHQWRENLALVAAWLAEFGGTANAEPPHIQWQSPSTISESPKALLVDTSADVLPASSRRPADLADVEGSKVDSRPGFAPLPDSETQDLTAVSAEVEALASDEASSEDEANSEDVVNSEDEAKSEHEAK